MSENNGWKSFETAPKDGQMILICLPRQMNLITRAWYNKIHGHWLHDYETDGSISRPLFFTKDDLWHPMPDLPKHLAN